MESPLDDPEDTVAMEESDVTQDWAGGNDLLRRIFTNDLIWRTLGSYLNHDDLKECRLVCSEFNRKIHTTTKFKDRTTFGLPGSALLASELGAKCMSVDLSSTGVHRLVSLEANTRGVALQLEQAESLTLRSNSEAKFSLEVIKKLLLAPAYLRKLTLDVETLLKMTPEVFLEAGSSLVHLCELTVTSPAQLLDSQKFRKAAENLMALFGAARKLHSVSLPQFVKENRFGPSPADIVTTQRLLLSLYLSASSLVTVNLQDVLFWTAMPGPLRPVFANIKEITVRARKADCSGVASFIRSHCSTLEALDIAVKGTLTPDLFRVIEMLTPQRLKKLRITCNAFDWDDKSKWKFLKTSKLQEFAFHLHKGSVPLPADYVQEFFGQLPPTLRSLRVRGIMKMRREPGPPVPYLKCLDARLLSRLDLSRCRGIVTDGAVEYICRNFRLLRYLDLSGAGCTDFGLTGLSNSDSCSDFSVADVKGLKTLVLQQCSGLSDLTLTEGVKFLELQCLDLRGNEQFSDSAVNTVLQSNPSLKCLKTGRKLQRRGSRVTLDYVETDIGKVGRRKCVVEVAPGDDSDDDEPRRSVSSDVAIYSAFAAKNSESDEDES